MLEKKKEKKEIGTINMEEREKVGQYKREDGQHRREVGQQSIKKEKACYISTQLTPLVQT